LGFYGRGRTILTWPTNIF